MVADKEVAISRLVAKGKVLDDRLNGIGQLFREYIALRSSTALTVPPERCAALEENIRKEVEIAFDLTRDFADMYKRTSQL